jgi:hypothetical protein
MGWIRAGGTRELAREEEKTLLNGIDGVSKPSRDRLNQCTLLTACLPHVIPAAPNLASAGVLDKDCRISPAAKPAALHNAGSAW